MAYEQEMKTGAAIARKAGELALKIREGNIGVESKSDESPVTIADKQRHHGFLEAFGQQPSLF